MMFVIVVCLVLVVVSVLIVTSPTVFPDRDTQGLPGSRGDVSRPHPLAEPPVNGEEPVWMNDVRNALADGQKIKAIKLYRNATGAGLRQAKDAVEKIQH